MTDNKKGLEPKLSKQDAEVLRVLENAGHTYFMERKGKGNNVVYKILSKRCWHSVTPFDLNRPELEGEVRIEYKDGFYVAFSEEGILKVSSDKKVAEDIALAKAQEYYRAHLWKGISANTAEKIRNRFAA